MKLANTLISLEFAPGNQLCQIVYRGQSMLAGAVSGGQSLFALQFRDRSDGGKALLLTGNDFARRSANLTRQRSTQTLVLDFAGHPAMPELCAQIAVTLTDDSAMTFWRLSLQNIAPDFELEYQECPRLYLSYDLRDNGGRAEFFWPGAEGTLFERLDIRTGNAPFAGGRLSYPLDGLHGYYPGTCPMQFVHYNRDGAGLYFAAHDPGHTPKGIDVLLHSPEVMESFFQNFCGGAAGSYRMDFDMVLGGLDGDWQDAAIFYRAWMEQNDSSLPPKLAVNPAVPQWLKDSPLVLIYPVKGRGFDTGSVSGNEYFPYSNALPAIRHYATAWNSQIMALLMHWEGTAPWAPPYVWPPYGGEEMFGKFVDALHHEGNLVGLYCSGIGWTQRSSLDVGYTREQEFAEKNLQTVMCTGPEGEMFAKVCNGEPGKGQRIGYEMCPECDFTVDTVCDEVAKVAAAGVDYMQYFDQNQGCSAPFCYSRDHGHEPAPGAWLPRAMQHLLARSDQAAQTGPRQTILGCENAAAEPYIKYLPFNDLRSHLAWGYGGRAVPAYPMLFHEYNNSFTGNGVCMAFWFDHRRDPAFLQYRTVYSFVAGEVLSAVLKDNGRMHWAWVCSWDEDAPDQALMTRLIGNLNRCRREEGHDYLVFGRMEKSIPVKCAKWSMTTSETPARILTLPTVLASSWSFNGRRAQVLGNMSETEQEVTVLLPGPCRVRLIYGRDRKELTAGGQLVCTVPPLDTLVIESMD